MDAYTLFAIGILWSVVLSTAAAGHHYWTTQDPDGTIDIWAKLFAGMVTLETLVLGTVVLL